VDDFAFGETTKYVQLEHSDSSAWDNAVTSADSAFGGMTHDLFTNNCHSHVARALNHLNYEGKHWNMVRVWWVVCTRSQYVSFAGLLKTYWGFMILALIVSFLYMLT
jgi:hypothetical protein